MTNRPATIDDYESIGDGEESGAIATPEIIEAMDEVRQREGRSWAQLGREAGVSKQMISYIRSNPWCRTRDLRKLLRVLKLEHMLPREDNVALLATKLRRGLEGRDPHAVATVLRALDGIIEDVVDADPAAMETVAKMVHMALKGVGSVKGDDED